MQSQNTVSPVSTRWVLHGLVTHGDKLGRTIGFPTANLVIGDTSRPSYGIYASIVTLPDGRRLHGATNFGIRPTFSPPKELLETFIFDFDEDLYGEYLEVELVHFMRPEQRFDDIESLTAQMQRDCAAARAILIRISPEVRR